MAVKSVFDLSIGITYTLSNINFSILFSKIKIIYHEPYYVREQILEEKNNDNYLLVSNEIMNIIKG